MCFKQSRAAGFSLPELLLLIVVFSIGLAGILIVINTTVTRSADPMLQKQAMAVAESMLEEVLLQAYTPGPGTGGRANFDDVRDYQAFATTGIQTINGTPIAGLGNYNISVTVAGPTGFNGANALLVTVAVTGRASYTIQGYKFDY